MAKMIIINNCAVCPYAEGDIRWEDAIYCNHWKRGEQVLIEKLTEDGRKTAVLPDCPLMDYAESNAEVKVFDYANPSP